MLLVEAVERDTKLDCCLTKQGINDAEAVTQVELHKGGEVGITGCCGRPDDTTTAKCALDQPQTPAARLQSPATGRQHHAAHPSGGVRSTA
jgi:hypothetical protein